MSKILEVLNKKIELKSEKVELGLVQDLDKMRSDSQKDTVKARVIGRELKDIYSNALKSLNNTNKEISKAYSKFKELGVSDTSELDNIAKKIARDIEGISEMVKITSRLG